MDVFCDVVAASRDDLDRKKRGELDRVMKRAREERSSYWNKRVLEAEEKDPSRYLERFLFAMLVAFYL